MRMAALVVLAGCTFRANGEPVLKRPKPDPDRMTSAELEHQDPLADTSKHRSHEVGGSSGESWCRPPPGFYCSAGEPADALLLAVSLLVPLRRRRNRS